MSINGGTDKEDVVQIYNEILLETVIQNEVRKRKIKHCMVEMICKAELETWI